QAVTASPRRARRSRRRGVRSRFEARPSRVGAAPGREPGSTSLRLRQRSGDAGYRTRRSCLALVQERLARSPYVYIALRREALTYRLEPVDPRPGPTPHSFTPDALIPSMK